MLSILSLLAYSTHAQTCQELSIAAGGDPGEELECYQCTSSYEECNPNCEDLTVDGADWDDNDSQGPYTCEDFWLNTWCDEYGDWEGDGGLTADQACCACGGGTATKLQDSPKKKARSIPGSSPSFSVTISSASAAPWDINVVLTAEQDMTFPIHQTPLDHDLFACGAFSVFDATAPSHSLKHIGAIAKRQPPSQDDMVTMVAGETRSVNVDLSRCYSFEASQEYIVRLKNHKTTHRFLSFTASTAPQARRQDSSRGRNLLAVGNDGCDADQWATTEDAIVNAVAALQDTNANNLDPGCAGDDYTRLFGVYTQERYSIIVDHYANLQERFEDETYTVVCNSPDCSSGVFAFVYPGDTAHNIYVCDAYWSASVTLTFDSKPGTLIHEMSHFNDVAGTDDHQYGFEGCKELAISDPCLAVYNADSHEYYVEQGLISTGCCADSSSCSESYCTDGGSSDSNGGSSDSNGGSSDSNAPDIDPASSLQCSVALMPMLALLLLVN